MGSFDIFTYTCPQCGNEANSQTKMFNCEFDDLKIGSIVDIDDIVLELKEPCWTCKKTNCVVVKDKKIINFVRTGLKKNYYKEAQFGNIEFGNYKPSGAQ